MASIYEVAEAAGVSASTVSRTFNSPHLIKDNTKRRVLEAAERINYRHPSLVRAPVPPVASGQTTPTVLGFHFFAEQPEDTLQRNAFYSQVLAGALSEASDLDVRLVLSSSGRHDTDAALPRIVQNSALAGMLLVGAPNPQTARQFTDRFNDVVFVDTYDPSGKHDSVVSDNAGGAQSAVSYLIAMGHRRIAFATGNDEVDSFNERLNGYVCAHFRAGLPLDHNLIVRKNHASIRACLELPNRPTAIMGASDDCALVVMQVCHQLGLTIPGDISLIGFDDLDFAERVMPLLTSVHVPAGNLGRLGLRRLYAKVTDGVNLALVDLPSRSLVPVSLVERDSCAPPRQDHDGILQPR